MHNVFSRFHLTGVAFEYLLKLVSAHLPDSKHCVSIKSLHAEEVYGCSLDISAHLSTIV